MDSSQSEQWSGQRSFLSSSEKELFVLMRLEKVTQIYKSAVRQIANKVIYDCHHSQAQEWLVFGAKIQKQDEQQPYRPQRNKG